MVSVSFEVEACLKGIEDETEQARLVADDSADSEREVMEKSTRPILSSRRERGGEVRGPLLARVGNGLVIRSSIFFRTGCL